MIEAAADLVDAPREMHKVTCAECGKETEVPFKPDGTRPFIVGIAFKNISQKDSSKKN